MAKQSFDLLDQLEKVSSIPAPGYVSGEWLNNITSSTHQVEHDDSNETEYGLF